MAPMELVQGVVPLNIPNHILDQLPTPRPRSSAEMTTIEFIQWDTSAGQEWYEIQTGMEATHSIDSS
eukprot:scaffold24522_cov127-Cylindrotheca_fusiformis.AAC.2